jgi:hypothetical protein
LAVLQRASTRNFLHFSAMRVGVGDGYELRVLYCDAMRSGAWWHRLQRVESLGARKLKPHRLKPVRLDHAVTERIYGKRAAIQK